MANIRALDAGTIARIAAGEVVERPASAVKELVENAADAGATEIAIRIEDGGRRLIRVSDNGRGMPPGDVALCVQSHTTSKLRGIEDLDTLRTLGFRGEALNSIAAVSRMTVISCAAGSSVCHSVRVDGGAVVSSAPHSRVPGTTIEVADLFYNVPARLKFMKSAQSEVRKITELTAHFMLARPDIGFRLESGGRELMAAPPGETHIDRLRLILGKDIAAHVRHATGASHGATLDAWFCMPDLSFPNRRYQIFFVNGHLVRDRTMSVAADVAYKGLVSRGRFALTVLFLNAPPTDVDVNVHPAKTEVRFRRNHDIHSLIYRTLREQFTAVADTESARPFTLITNTPEPAPVEPEQILPPFHNDKKQQYPRLEPKSAGARLDTASHRPPAPAFQETFSLAPPAHTRDALDIELDRQAELALSDAAAPEAPLRPAHFEILGQFYNTFILVNLEGRPVFIDQHVAGERVIYNRLKRAQRARPAQLTLLSDPVEVPHDVFQVIIKNLGLIQRAGVEVEPFGERAFVIRSVTHNAGPFDAAEMLVSMAHDIATAPYAAEPGDLLDRLLVIAACKLAVKAGQPLSHEEMRALIADYFAEDANRTCPHGRPIIHEISLNELKAWFHR